MSRREFTTWVACSSIVAVPLVLLFGLGAYLGLMAGMLIAAGGIGLEERAHRD